MKTTHVVILVVSSCVLTFVASVLFSINMASIEPKKLAEVIEKDPVLFLDTLKASAEKAQAQMAQKRVEEQMKNPKDIAIEGRVTFGKQDAPVTIVEYSDFQCRFCAEAYSKRLQPVKDKYDGKVKVVYKHFPLDFHPFAKPAAEYFEAVAQIDQDKAKQFHDVIFADYSEFQKSYARLKSKDEIDKAIKSIVKKIGLKMVDVEKHLKKGKEIVATDMVEANKLGVGGTPTFFVNGVNAQGIGLEELVKKFAEN